MSSPLSNLKKPKKSPFSTAGHGNRSVPFRSPNNTADENNLLDEVTSHMSSKILPKMDTTERLKKSTNQYRSPKTSTSSAPSDQELMTLMLTRVSQLEQRVQFQSKEISEKDKKIKVLEEKLRIIQRTRDTDNHGKVFELEKKCLLLQEHVHEMESFLADYGMVWIGEKSNPDSNQYIDEKLCSDDEEVWKPDTSLPKEFVVDYDVIIENVHELNVLAGEGISKIQHTVDGARLKMPDPIPLTLFANGILMFRGPFRPFTDHTTQLCIRDLMDGYFPSELQSRYPDGVPISISDKRHTLFKDPRSIESFKGVGQVLGGDTKPSRLVNSNLSKTANKLSDPPHEDVTSEIPGPKLTVEQFLNKLPASVVKQGRIIDIRNSLGDALQSDSSGPNKVHLVETEAVQEMKDRMEKEESQRPPSSREITTLRIKSDQGDQTYILKMKFSQTIGAVRKHLDELRPPGAPSYQIISTFPSRTYSNNEETLKKCGLVPNAALHLRSVKK